MESFWAKITDKGNKEMKKKSHPLCSELKKAPGRNPSFFGMVYITVYENLQKCLIFELKGPTECPNKFLYSTKGEKIRESLFTF